MKSLKMSLISSAFIIAVLAFWVDFAYKNLGEFLEVLVEIDAYHLLLSFPILLVTYVIVIYNWRTILGISGHKRGFSFAARSWLIPNLAKYIPGKIWTIIARGYYGKKENVPLSNMYTSWFLEVYLQIAATVIISIVYMTINGAEFYFIYLMVLVLLLVTSMAFKDKGIVIAARVISKARGGRNTENLVSAVRGIKMKRLVGPFLIYMIKYAVYGLWMLVIAQSIPGADADLAFFMFCWALSWVIGFVVIFAPGGLGVREGVMTLLLTSAGYSPGAAITIAFLTRMEFFIMDTILGLSAVAVGKRRVS